MTRAVRTLKQYFSSLLRSSILRVTGVALFKRMTEHTTETDTVYISVYFTHSFILRLPFITSIYVVYDDDSLISLF